MTPGIWLALWLTGCGGAVRHIPPPPVTAHEGTAVNAEARERYLRGQLLMLQGQDEAAAAELALAGRFDPGSGAVKVARGDAAMATGDPRQAQRLWEEAVALPEDAWGSAAETGRAWLRLARLHRVLREVPEAADAYAQAVSRLPRDARAWSERAEVLARMGDQDAIVAHAAAWSQLATEDRETLLRRSEVRQLAGDLAGAHADLDAYLEQQPDDVAAMDRYLILSEQLGLRRTALQRLTGAWQAVPTDPRVLQRLVGLCEETGHLPRLASALDALVALLTEEGAAELAVDRARVALGRGRPAEALALLDEAGVDGAWAGLYRGKALLELGRRDEARAVLEAIETPSAGLAMHTGLLTDAGAEDTARRILVANLLASPGRPAVWQAAVRHEIGEGKLAAARDLLAMHSGLSDAEQERTLGRMQAELGNRTGAAIVLQVELERLTRAGGEPADLAATARLLAAVLLEDEPAEALAVLDRSAASDPSSDDTDARSLRASALWALGRTDDALALGRALLSEAPDDASLQNLVAWGLVHDGASPDAAAVDEALALARRAVEQAPASPHYLDTLGVALARHGDRTAALELLVEAQGLAPDQPEIAAHLAALRDGTGLPVVLPAPADGPPPAP